MVKLARRYLLLAVLALAIARCDAVVYPAAKGTKLPRHSIPFPSARTASLCLPYWLLAYRLLYLSNARLSESVNTKELPQFKFLILFLIPHLHYLHLDANRFCFFLGFGCFF